MTRKPIFAANWKMNMGASATEDFVRSFLSKIQGQNFPCEIVIAPPFIPQPGIAITGLFYGPLVPPVMELNFSDLSPYDNYQLEFSPVATGTWTNLGAPFVPTATTNTQYANGVGNLGFFRVKHLP